MKSTKASSMAKIEKVKRFHNRLAREAREQNRGGLGARTN